MELTITNEKGLFGLTNPRPVITEKGFAHLKRWRADTLLSGEEAKRVDGIIALLDRLPVFKALTYLLASDDPNTFKSGIVETSPPKAYGSAPCRGWLFVDSVFVGTSMTVNWPGEASPEGLGWTVLTELLKAEKDIQKLFSRLDISYGYHGPLVGAPKVIKNHTRWSLSMVDPIARLGQTDAHAIYNPAERGYLNDKGYWVPLAGARLFESAEAARRTNRSRNLTGTIIVEIDMAVRAIADALQQPDLGEFGEVVAHAERKRLVETLDKIELDDLLAQVEKIKQTHPEIFEERATAVPRRRI